MTLIEIKPCGHDPLLSEKYEEFHECDHCGNLFSFDYYTDWSLETIKRVAKDRHKGRTIKEDLCYECWNIEETKMRRGEKQKGLEEWLK